MSETRDVHADLAVEQEQLEALLAGLADADWDQPSSCQGWTISDVVLHLAQTEEAVVASVTGEAFRFPGGLAGGNVDEIVAGWVKTERGASPDEVFGRWKAARRAALSALADADPDAPVTWAAAPLKPRTLATTRLSEHWTHAQDVAEPLGADYPDTDRLWHIARLAHRTVPYAYARAGRDDPPSIRLRLAAPSGDIWEFGDAGAEVEITGSASEFCRVAGRRLDPADAELEAGGGRAVELLSLVRTYA